MTEPSAAVADCIRSRRTVHQFLTEAVPQAVVLEAIEHARWAPNHHLTEPWRFDLLGPESIAAVLRLARAILTEQQGERPAEAKVARWSNIPGWLFVSYLRDADPLRDRENYAATCCAMQNLQLSLWSRGLGVKWTTGPVTRDPRLFDLLGLDPDARGSVGLFWYGYPESVGEQKRQPVEAIARVLP